MQIGERWNRKIAMSNSLGDTWSREQECRGEHDKTILKAVISASWCDMGCRMKPHLAIKRIGDKKSFVLSRRSASRRSASRRSASRRSASRRSATRNHLFWFFSPLFLFREFSRVQIGERWNRKVAMLNSLVTHGREKRNVAGSMTGPFWKL